jgi:Spy/CpxP family protein refolding chaperone
MKILKNVMPVLFALLIITSAKAQDHSNRKQRGEERMKELSTRLNLTTDQETKIQAIMKENREEMKQLRETKKEAPKEEKKAVFMTQMKKADAKIPLLNIIYQL